MENGPYEVTVCLGDAEYPSTDHTLFVEGVAFCRSRPLAEREFLTLVGDVAVEDGTLTLESNNNPPGAAITKLCRLELTKR